MRKHRILAGFLAAVMLLGTMPAALAAESTSGIQLNKTAGAFNANWETEINLTVSAPTDEPVAVEFVLDGTYSMFKNTEADKDNPDKLMIEAWAEAIKEQLADKNVHVGVTVFGSEARTLQPITELTSDSDFDTDLVPVEAIKWLLDHEGTNVQAGIRSGMEQLNKLDTKVIPAENRYLVLITDGGSFWRLNAKGEAINDTTSDGTYLQNNDAAELLIAGGSLRSEGELENLVNVDTTFHEYDSAALSDVLSEIRSTNAYTNFEKGVYAAAEELDAIQGVKLMTIGYPYYDEDARLTQLTSLARDFIDKAMDQSVYSVFLPSVEATSGEIDSIAGNIAAQIAVTVRKGSTITDVIGNGTDNLKAAYNFDLVTDKPVKLTINGTTYTGTKNGNTWTFGDGSKLVYTPGDNERFVLTLGQDLQPGTPMTLTYTAKLTNPSKDSGKHTVYPNVEAYLKPAGTSGQLKFPDPALIYNVGGGSSGGGSSVLNTDDHYSYIIGYKDGYVRPYGTITRGEVATIFFRLLTDEARDKYWSQDSGYSDCGPDLWCNNAISTLSNMGIIDGYSDGTFRPYGKITRAQFAKIAVGFFETTKEEYQGYYTDVPEDAWFTDYVEAASRVGLIQGFQDGSFRPNANITRAQACVIVNRALDRKPDKDHLLPVDEMITWPDNNPGDWYYADMQEATNSHDYTWLKANGETKGMEQWTEKLPQRDWAAFEHAWSTAHSAPGGEVVK
ncbi:S-layer homology domain-containing protein [Dysosmobacter sp.]|uniref:S-layer homology domain-containing protein n=1 Tax=Dysosmobacter sp. TaxID=2591382 RepID=UPI002A99DAD7|nr:S-layer homology domain-containing protein [Dysosmobacter sp.]MDY5612353.1 S-layer homology domain-containing protein [Dysosmobacter sp.]